MPFQTLFLLSSVVPNGKDIYYLAEAAWSAEGLLPVGTGIVPKRREGSDSVVVELLESSGGEETNLYGHILISPRSEERRVGKECRL